MRNNGFSDKKIVFMDYSHFSVVRKFNNGVDNLVYKILLADNSQGVLKVYTKRSMNDVLEIQKISAFLRENSTPVPKIFKIIKFNGKPATLMEYFRGRHISTLSIPQIYSVASLMASIHGLKRYRDFIDSKSVVIANYEILFNKCAQWKKTEELKNIFYKLNLDYLKIIPKGLIHGDFSSSNILFGPKGKIIALLDCDHSGYSHLLTDLAVAQLFFGFNKEFVLNEGVVSEFMRAYNKCRVLVDAELKNFYIHMSLLTIKIILETYYYVEVKKEIKFRNTKHNQSYHILLKKLQQIKGRKEYIF